MTEPDPPVTVSVHGDRDLSPAAQEALGALIEVATGQIRSNAPLCTWLACLTPAQQTELADEVTASMLGEPTTPRPDQRPICGCREPHACGNCEGVDPDRCLMNPHRPRVSFTDVVEIATEEEMGGPDPWKPTPSPRRHSCPNCGPAGPGPSTTEVLRSGRRLGAPAPDGDGQAAAVCHCGLGTRQQCATEPWGCAHDREHAPKAPQSGDGTNCACPCEGCAHWCAGHPNPTRCLGATLADISGAGPAQVSRMLTAVEAHRDAELERLRVERDDALAVADADSKQLAEVDVRCDTAAAELRAVRAELDRIAELPTVTCDDGRADRFSTGARWTLRMIREVLNGQEHTP